MSPRSSNPGKSGSRSSNNRKLSRLRLKPRLRFFRAQLDLDQHRQPPSQPSRGLVKPFRQRNRIKRVHRCKKLRRTSRLIRLQMANQVKLRRRLSGSQLHVALFS